MDRMERPEPEILPDSALVPAGSLIEPAPTSFTHQLTVAEPFHYVDTDLSSPAAGVLAAGTKVVVLSRSGEVCDVVDGQGLHVVIRAAGLRRLA